MKGHKAHHHAHHEHKGVKHHGVHHHHPRAEHAKGGKAESPHHGVKDHDEAPHEVYEGAGSPVVKEAKQRKHGGKAKHHVDMHGHKGHHRADRVPRKSGGRAGSNMHPLSSAHHGTAPKGRHGLEMN